MTFYETKVIQKRINTKEKKEKKGHGNYPQPKTLIKNN